MFSPKIDLTVIVWNAFWQSLVPIGAMFEGKRASARQKVYVGVPKTWKQNRNGMQTFDCSISQWTHIKKSWWPIHRVPEWAEVGPHLWFIELLRFMSGGRVVGVGGVQTLQMLHMPYLGASADFKIYNT